VRRQSQAAPEMAEELNIPDTLRSRNMSRGSETEGTEGGFDDFNKARGSEKLMFDSKHKRLTFSETLTLKASMDKANSMFLHQAEEKDDEYISNMKDEMLGSLEFKHAVQSFILFLGSIVFTWYDLEKGHYAAVRNGNGEDMKISERLNWCWSPIALYGVANIVIVAMMYGELPKIQSDYSKRRALLGLYLLFPILTGIAEVALGAPTFYDSSMILFVSAVHHFPGKVGVHRSWKTVAYGSGFYCLCQLVNFAIIREHKLHKLAPLFGWWVVQHIYTKLPETLQLQNYLLHLSFDEEQEILMENIKKSETLLERVLPRAIIPRIKTLRNGAAIADEFNSVTIIFAKVLGIHDLFDKLPTVQVVEVIDMLYKRFDDLTDKHMIEKIKTVGDTYMAGAGLPVPDDDHASHMAHFAFAMIENIKDFNNGTMLQDDLSYKIGVSSGPVVAGVIGSQNFTYDLWGDAANTASRMYSCGVKGRIQTTKATTEILKDEFEFESRGMINVKGKGMMECFLFVQKRDASDPMIGIRKPNNKMHARVNKRQLRRGVSDDRGRRRSSIHKNAPIHMIANYSNDKIAEMMANKDDLKIGKHLWTGDESSQHCEECNARFTICFRRHHCRFCGRLLCDNCSNQKIYKQRSCEQCVAMKDDLVDAHEMLRKAEKTRKDDKLRRATMNFLNPIRAVLHTIRSGTLRGIEFSFNKDRKEAISIPILTIWLIMICCVAILNNIYTSNIMNDKCIDPLITTTATEMSWENAEESCAKLKYCTDLNLPINTTNNTACFPGERVRAYDEDMLVQARFWTSCIVIPITTVYVFITRLSYDIRLEILGSVLQVIIGGVFLNLAVQAHYYGWVMLFYLTLINTYSTMPYLFAAVLSTLLALLYVVLGTNQSCFIGLHDNKLCSNTLDFIVEKFVHMMLVSIVIGYKLDARHRGMFMKLMGIKKQQETIETEQGKHGKLISLPPILVEGLKSGKQVVLDAYGTILFADIVSFTVFSTNMVPIRLVQILNDMFAMHDELAKRVGVDKVKTLGDCYVACTGVLSPLANHAASMVQFGIGMHWVMAKLNIRHKLNGKGPFGKDLRIRVGVASGAVVGGVVGGKKFIFDVWGETVEEAEVMESGGVPERTHVSQTTYVRASKESSLSFEPLDRLPEEGYTGGQSYLAIIPSDVESWLEGVCGDAQTGQLRRHGSRRSNNRRSKNNSPTNGLNPNTGGVGRGARSSVRRIRDSLASFENPLFRSSKRSGKSVDSKIDMTSAEIEDTLEKL
jgi:class 3 adenylate cyclase